MSWDPTVFSPDNLIVEYEQHCAHDTECNRCASQCPCWKFLAPHRFMVCLMQTVMTVDQFVVAGAYQVDCESLVEGLLGHVWAQHTSYDSTGLDELRRCEEVMRVVAAEMSPQTAEMVERFVDERIVEAFNRDIREDHQTGLYPCGASVEDEDVQHVRLATMTTADRWQTVLKGSRGSDTPICGACGRVAASEIAFTAA